MVRLTALRNAIVLVSIAIFASSPGAHSAVKPVQGKACKVAGKKQSFNGLEFACVKIGKKTVWQKTQITPVAKKLALPTSRLSESDEFNSVDNCKILDGDPNLTNYTAGFPIPTGRINLVQGSNAQILGVDFPDKQGGSSSPRELYSYYMEGVEKFWASQSSVPTKFEWNWNRDWIRMDGPIKSYGLGGSFFAGKFDGPKYFDFAQSLLDKVDTEIDFTKSNLLIIVFPPGIKSDEIGTFLVHTQRDYLTKEGVIPNLIMAGGDYVNVETYIHEYGHTLGLTDIRDTRDVGNQKSDMYFDAMNNPYFFPEIFVWHRFLLGLLLPEQIHCKTDTATSTHWIVPVAGKSPGVRGVLLPISTTEVIVIESRRPAGYDRGLDSNPDLIGAVVYLVDSKIPYGQSPIKVIDVIKSGESVSINNKRISVIESGDFGDVIRVETST